MLEKILKIFIGTKNQEKNIQTNNSSDKTQVEQNVIEKQEDIKPNILVEEDKLTINVESIKKQVINKNETNITDAKKNSSIDKSTELFNEEKETKEEKIKQVLELEHIMNLEEMNDTYEYPPIELLTKGNTTIKSSKKEIADTASKLQKTLHSFGVSAKVENVSVGPTITTYEVKPAEGVRISEITKLKDDIALNLEVENINIEAPIPGKKAVGIQILNQQRSFVYLRELLDTTEFESQESKLAVALGKDITGENIIIDIEKMPHLIIAGETGSGKSVCINTIITSMLYKAKPSEIKFIMLDGKTTDLSKYNGIPHLLIPVVTSPRMIARALAWSVQEMENRYLTFSTEGVKNLKAYNETINETQKGMEKLPQIIIMMENFQDLIEEYKQEIEDAICRLAQKGKAAGIHLIISTQRPSVDILTGLIKANIPSRIAFDVSSPIDSKIILDTIGAEKLLGNGDMLFYPLGAIKPKRIQGAFISDEEVEKVVNFLKDNQEATYNEDIMESIEKANKTDKEMVEQDMEEDDTDPFLMDAIDVVVETGQASTSFIQRRFKVGYARAGRIIDQMEERGIISGYQGSNPREVLMTKERLEELKSNKDY